MTRECDSDLSRSKFIQEQLHHSAVVGVASRTSVRLPQVISTGLDTSVPTLLWFYRHTMFCSRQERWYNKS